MKPLTALLWLPILLAQDDPGKQAHELVEKLRSNDIEVRLKSVRKLKELGKSAVPELGKATTDSDAEVAANAKHLLKIIGIMETLTPNLKKTMPQVEDRLALGLWREVFLEAEGYNEANKRTYPTLTKEDLDILAVRAVQGSKTSEEKMEVCDAVARRGLRGAIPPTLGFLEDVDGRVRVRAVVSLRCLQAREAVPHLIKLLRDPDPEVMTITVRALGDLRAKEAAPEIAKLLHHENGSVSGMAALALGDLDFREAASEIANLLEGADSSNQASAATALASLGFKEAVPKITKLLRSKELYTLHSALDALASLDAKEATPEIVELLGAREPTIRCPAVRTLAELGAQESSGEIAKLLKDPDGQVKSAAARALGDLAVKVSIPEIKKLLNDSDQIVLSAAANALVDLGATEEILKLLVDKNVVNRWIAVLTLGNAGVKECIPGTIPLLQDPNGKVRIAAACALGHLGAKEALPELLRLLHKKEEKKSAGEFANTLCRLGNRDGVPILLELARNAQEMPITIDPVFWAPPEGIALYSLNALRQPGAWQRLRTKSLSRDLKGRGTGELQELLAKEGGYRLEFVEGSYGPLRGPLRRRMFAHEGRRSVLQALEEECDQQMPGYDFIVEPDVIRILPCPEALKFWTQWWSDETKRK
jgi:HEAT repeat protein